MNDSKNFSLFGVLHQGRRLRVLFDGEERLELAWLVEDLLEPGRRRLGTHPSRTKVLSVKPKLFRTSSFFASMESCSSTTERMP